MRFLSAIVAAIALLALSACNADATTCSATAACKTGAYVFHASDSTNPVTLYTATGNGAEVDGIFCSSTVPSNANPLQLWLLKSSNEYLMNTIGFSATSGTNNTFVANLLTYTLFNQSGTTPYNALPIDGNGNSYIKIASGDAIQVAMSVALSGSNTITCIAQVIQF